MQWLNTALRSNNGVRESTRQSDNPALWGKWLLKWCTYIFYTWTHVIANIDLTNTFLNHINHIISSLISHLLHSRFLCRIFGFGSNWLRFICIFSVTHPCIVGLFATHNSDNIKVKTFLHLTLYHLFILDLLFCNKLKSDVHSNIACIQLSP